MSRVSEYLSCARSIDADRASLLAKEYRSLEPGTGDLAVLLGAAYPALCPSVAWQFDALRALVRGGMKGPGDRAATVARVWKHVPDLADDVTVQRGLRRAAWAEKARIALAELLPRELGGQDVAVTARELSYLGDALLEVALAEALAHVERRRGVPLSADGVPARLVVLGLGKLGGEELNPGSDLDVMFVCDADYGAGGSNLHDHFVEVARRLVMTVETPTEDGFVWRLDLRLRPEGSQGALVNSLEAAERYYATWGRLWERAALLRCRPVAGDAALGAEFMRDIAVPFVYPRKVDPRIAETMADLVARSRRELSKDPGRDLKLGPGGIREAEFFVQTLQLVWGGQEPSLRVPSLLSALERLVARGLVTHREAQTVEAAYLLLRQVEHRIQFMSGLQSHLLFEDTPSLERLARSLRISDAGALVRELERRRREVERLFGSLVPERSVPDWPQAAHYRQVLECVDTNTPEALALEASPLSDPEVLDHLRGLARRPDNLLGILTRERHPELAPRILAAVADAPDPWQAARYLHAFFARFLSPAPYVSLLADDAQVLRRFVHGLGASAIVGDAVVAQPDTADLILFGAPAVAELIESVRQEIGRACASSADAEPDEGRERLVGILRRARQRAIVTVADADLAGLIETREATRLLSAVADEVLERALCYELGSAGGGLVVIAVGKFGGSDIGYGSDLDVLFVFDPDAVPRGRSPEEHFIRVAQRVIRLISEPHPAGRGYELDTRLRPSGAHGLLVTSLEAFARYHRVGPSAAADGHVVASSAPWERQALLRARLAAGDRELGARVLEIAETAAYERGACDPEELHRLRLRMQHELAREGSGRYDVKLGHGGLLDVEFAAQWLQMLYGRDESVRTPDTGDALLALSSGGYLAEEVFDVLSRGYTFLRRLEQRLHVLHGTSASEIDVRRGGVPELARRMGLRDSPRETAARALIERYLSVTGAVRETYLSVLGVQDAASRAVPGRS